MPCRTTRYLATLLHIFWVDFSLAALTKKTRGTLGLGGALSARWRRKLDEEERKKSDAESTTTWAFVPP